MNRLVASAAALAAVIGFSIAAQAASVKVENPFARPSMGASKTSAAFMTLKNDATAPDRLVRAESDVADRVELHTHIMKKQGDRVIMQMRPVKAMDIPAGGTTVLKPGGLHIMLIGVRKPLKPGDSFSMKLIFDHADPVTVQVPVKKIGAGMMHGGMKMKMKMKKPAAN